MEGIQGIRDTVEGIQGIRDTEVKGVDILPLVLSYTI